MASAKHSQDHSQDRTFYVLRDPTEVNDPIVTTDENEAFDMWLADKSWFVDSYNPVEAWALPLADEWHEFANRGMRPIVRPSRFSTASAYPAMSRAS